MSKLSRAIGLTAIFAAILFNPVFAQKSKKPPKVWAQEPTSVLGIKLGVPLVDLALRNASRTHQYRHRMHLAQLKTNTTFKKGDLKISLACRILGWITLQPSISIMG